MAQLVGKQVVGPGVAAAVPAPDGQWWHYLNGFAPGDMPDGPDGKDKVRIDGPSDCGYE
ncbi:hypothetical protein [Granulicella sibirica]|uniref:Uncharacterized protein n=1 Tax=Granulicella sibirica TaxID=2479048 RepID=A0A4Q0SWS5_9BACT|nr:hypothetical protein [Granulicella sibirica]RXH53889.1 hypothetical protein GRAN_5227 [Granulicella sibirica]